MSASWDWPGSRWWRLDLHAHSPASYDFKMATNSVDPVWTHWVEAARDAGLHAVAVTDHDTAAAITEIQDAAAAVHGAPVVFPAVEVTTSCGTHLLFLLDPSAQQRHVEEFLSRANIPTGERGSQRAQSNLSLEQVLDLANELDGLFLGAHVNGPAGLLEHDGQQRLRELNHQNLAGVEVDPDRALDASWLDGSRPEIDRSVPQVWCSDAHAFTDLGRRFTWVKMTRPDLEGLRLALLDGNGTSLLPARKVDSDDPNKHAHLVIECIRVQNARYMGRPEAIEFPFNPWFNAIIGGRGTGKSTLIDFCRKTLRRDAELDRTSLRDVFGKRLSIPGSRREEGLLTADTQLEIVYRKDGERFAIAWDAMGASPSIRRLDNEAGTPEEGDIRERFPVRIYSQKQLFELAQDPNALLGVIDDSEEVGGKDLQRQLRQVEERYLSLRAAARVAQTNAGEIPSRRASLADVKRKLEVLSEGGSAQALAAFRLRRQQDTTWRSILDGANSGIDSVARAAEELLVADLDLPGDPEGDPARDALRRMHRQLQDVVAELQEDCRASIDAARQGLARLHSEADAQVWRSAIAASEAEYERVAAQLAASGISSPNEYRDLVEKAASLEGEIQGLETEEERATHLESQASDELSRFRELRGNLTERRRAFAQSASGNLLRVSVNAHADRERETVVGSLRDILRIERFDNDHEHLAALLNSESNQAWTWDGLDALVTDLRRLLAGAAPDLPTQDARFLAALRRLSPEQVDRLALYAPDDAVDVSFCDHRKQDESWTPLAQGSPGQQTAALLAFVLGYGSEPILLDQPEDDLDNTLIYELLVQRLRETKVSRQVIVVTHNPNIVVHGDAELVMSLDARGGQTRINCKGGLQERAVRNEICRVMEGGSEAFETRYRRIMPLERNP